MNQLSNGTTDTDTEEDVMEKEETSKEETAVTGVSSFSQAGEAELKSKKVCRIILLSNGFLAWQIKWWKGSQDMWRWTQTGALPLSFATF